MPNSRTKRSHEIVLPTGTYQLHDVNKEGFNPSFDALTTDVSTVYDIHVVSKFKIILINIHRLILGLVEIITFPLKTF